MGVDGAHYTVIIFSCSWNIQLGYHDCCFIICSEVPFYALLNKQFFNPGIWTPPISGFGIDENHRDPEIRDPGLQSIVTTYESYLPRDSYAKRCPSDRNSVRLCVSNACFATKRTNIPPIFQCHVEGHSL